MCRLVCVLVSVCVGACAGVCVGLYVCVYVCMYVNLCRCVCVYLISIRETLPRCCYVTLVYVSVQVCVRVSQQGHCLSCQGCRVRGVVL